jgi:nitroreductase
MKVSDAVARRRSAYLDEPVDVDLLRSLIIRASRAPSGGNLQPWHVHLLTGEPLFRFKDMMARRLDETPRGEGTEYPIYPAELVSPYKERVVGIGEALYAELGIARENRGDRRAWFANNFSFFGAPAGLFCFVDRRCGAAQWADLGMFLQSLMLLLCENGLARCPQECWAIYHASVTRFLSIPPEQMLFCGMAIGREDVSAPVNHLRSSRAPEGDFLTLHGNPATGAMA